MNQIEIVKQIANDMIGIGGIPTNQEFYDEFIFRVEDALNITTKRGIVDIKRFQYIDEAIKWINENNINVISVSDAGRFSEGFFIIYRS